MKNEDLRVFSGIGKALWLDSEESGQFTLDTLSAVSLLELNEERTLERAAAALLSRARSARDAGKIETRLRALNHPFFRLSAEERMILVSLHIGRWSYSRLSRIFQLAPEEVEEMAWSGRLKISPSRIYPAGPDIQKAECPIYHSTRPWTQKFFDEELAPTDKFFIQKHLMSCKSCAEALRRTREFYFEVQREVGQFVKGSSDEVDALIRACQESRILKKRTWRGFLPGLRVFSRRWDVRIALLIFAALTVIQFTR